MNINRFSAFSANSHRLEVDIFSSRKFYSTHATFFSQNLLTSTVPLASQLKIQSKLSVNFELN